MKTASNSIQAMRETATPQQYEPPFPPLELVTKPNVTTAEIAYYTNQAEQTWRVHACHETFPDELRPLRIGGRLNWPTVGLKKLLGISTLQKGFTTLTHLAFIVGAVLLAQFFLMLGPDLSAPLDWAGIAMLGAGVIGSRDSNSRVYDHPDGHSIDFSKDTLTSTTSDGKSVSIPIGRYGLLLLTEKLESIAMGVFPDVDPKLDPSKGDGLTTPHSQPAKTLTKYATDFIARCRLFARGIYLERSIDAGLIGALSLVLLQIAFIAIWRVL